MKTPLTTLVRFALSTSLLGLGLVTTNVVAAVPSSAGPIVTSHPGLGYLWNFDVANQTDRTCDGFEIQIDGVTPTDVLGTYWGSYGQPSVTATTFNGVAGIDVVYAATYSAGNWSYTTPVGGLEHFGVSLGTAPGDQRYTWLCENPSSPGTLQQYGGTTTGNGYPMPSNPNTVTTAGVNVPASPTAPVVEQVTQTISNPAPAPNLQADAYWACRWELNTTQSIALNNLLTDSSLVRATLSQAMINDQCDLMNPGTSVNTTVSFANGDKGEATVINVYAYTGPYDDAHTPLCNEITGDPNNCANFLGASIATDMLATTVANGGARFGLGVAVAGPGSVAGTDVANANANPGPIACSTGRCGEVVNAGTSVTLTASPAPGAAFTGWTGDCTSTATTCTVVLAKARNVVAHFATTATVDVSAHAIATGHAVTFTLTGTGFPVAPAAPPAVAVSGTGVSIKRVSSTDSTIVLTAKPSTSAATGDRTLTLTIGSKNKPGYQVLTCTACLTVNPSPVITGGAATLYRGHTGTITITGRNFQDGVVVGVSGTGVTVTVQSVSSTTIVLQTSVGLAAPRSTRILTVTNPDAGSAKSSLLTVK